MISCSCCGKTKPEKYSSGMCGWCYLNAHVSTKECSGCGQVAKMQGGGLCRKCYLAQPHMKEAKNQARREKYARDVEYREKVQVARRADLNTDRGKAANRRRNRLWNYGLTVERFEALKAHQDNKCAICLTELNESVKGGCHVDHCHTTGKVRGLLCGNCNGGLGFFKDNEDALKAALTYLESPPADKLP